MENDHIVTRFDEELNRIKADILEMGALVAAQIEGATEALNNFDTADVDRLVATDRRINGMHKAMYSSAERLIALRAPVALDLRRTLLPITIAGELERIGDHAKSTAKRVRKLTEGEPGETVLKSVHQMSDIVQKMLSDALVAYAENDIELAAKIRVTDKEVDILNKQIFAEALTAIAEKPDDAATLVHTILLARNFERVGDHIVNIARHVHQIATGEDLKFST